MRTTPILFFAVVLGAASGLSLDDAKNRPVTKVVTLLKDMTAQLEKEADDDQEIYEQMMCWCTTNDKEKTQSIADGEQRSIDLTASIEGGTAASARLNVEIKATDTDNEKNNKALDQATSLRGKEAAEFHQNEMNMLQSIAALKSAVQVLGKHHTALLQASKDGAEVQETAAQSTQLIKAGVMLKETLRKHAELLSGVITPTQKKAVLAFAETGFAVDAPKTVLLQKKKPEGSAGGEIFGILKNMQETFEANLAAAQREESESSDAFNRLKTAKEEEIAAGQTLLRMKTNELGSTDEKLANDKQDLEDTQNTLEADRAFLGNLKEKCQMFDNEFAQRTKNRQDEIGAVSKAMSILTGDDAHDLMTRTLDGGASFLQMRAQNSRSKARRSQAAAILVTTAKKVKDPRLSAVAMTVKLAGFAKVKMTLQNMVDRLIIEKEDEVQHKDWCNDGIRKNERETEMQDREKEGLVAKIEDLDNTMATLSAAIKQLEAEVAETQLQMKKMGEDREAANKEFQVTVADQRATQQILTNALDVLSGYYDTKLVQLDARRQAAPAGPPPPTGFKKYEKNAVSGGVMGMIQQIINDAKAMEAEAIQNENDAAQAYEDFTKDSNVSITDKTADIMNKSETKAQAEADKAEAETNLEAKLSELQLGANQNRDLHSSCDFVLNNFDIRQHARDDEIEALKQSISILSGASYGFMQKKH